MSDRKPLPTCESCKYWSLATTGFDDLDSAGEHVEDDGTDPFFGAVGICQRFPPTKTMDEVDNVYDVACYPVARPGWWCGEHQPATVADEVEFNPERMSPRMATRCIHRLVQLVNLNAADQYITTELRLIEQAFGGRHRHEPDEPQPTVADTPPSGT